MKKLFVILFSLICITLYSNVNIYTDYYVFSKVVNDELITISEGNEVNLFITNTNETRITYNDEEGVFTFFIKEKSFTEENNTFSYYCIDEEGDKLVITVILDTQLLHLTFISDEIVHIISYSINNITKT